jgi:hypothetical protein
MTSARQARQERVDAESVFVTSGDPPAVSAQSSHKRSIAHSTIDAYGYLPESACFVEAHSMSRPDARTPHDLGFDAARRSPLQLELAFHHHVLQLERLLDLVVARRQRLSHTPLTADVDVSSARALRPC